MGPNEVGSNLAVSKSSHSTFSFVLHSVSLFYMYGKNDSNKPWMAKEDSENQENIIGDMNPRLLKMKQMLNSSLN